MIVAAMVAVVAVAGVLKIRPHLITAVSRDAAAAAAVGHCAIGMLVIRAAAMKRRDHPAALRRTKTTTMQTAAGPSDAQPVAGLVMSIAGMSMDA